MVPSCITALIYKESEIGAFLMTMALCLLVGIPLICRKPKKKIIYVKEGFVTVALSWIALSIMGSLPFLFSGAIKIRWMRCLRLFPDSQQQEQVF